MTTQDHMYRLTCNDALERLALWASVEMLLNYQVIADGSVDVHEDAHHDVLFADVSDESLMITFVSSASALETSAVLRLNGYLI